MANLKGSSVYRGLGSTPPCSAIGQEHSYGKAKTPGTNCANSEGRRMRKDGKWYCDNHWSADMMAERCTHTLSVEGCPCPWCGDPR